VDAFVRQNARHGRSRCSGGASGVEEREDLKPGKSTSSNQFVGTDRTQSAP
jgi:hypothetical protein